LGLVWANLDQGAIRKATRELLAKQRPDGGWSDLDSMESSAYATGRSLYALQIANLPASDAAYESAVQYLLKTQLEDGSWYVRSRALALQPFFDAGFPHGFDQFISTAATNWATVALAQAGQSKTAVASRER
jgi:squalene cyclase